jgi:hypothetical protein
MNEPHAILAPRASSIAPLGSDNGRFEPDIGPLPSPATPHLYLVVLGPERAARTRQPDLDRGRSPNPSPTFHVKHAEGVSLRWP